MKLPKHEAELVLTHNEHKSLYEKIEVFVEREQCQWISDDEKRKAIAKDTVWELHWYPDTPVGFYSCCASSLKALLADVEKNFECFDVEE
jgi:hypothetical protein